jgi:hypothetical protein
METRSSSDYETTRRNIPEYSHLQSKSFAQFKKFEQYMLGGTEGLSRNNWTVKFNVKRTECESEFTDM